MQVFISYAREDKPTARRIYADLKRIGANPWLDKESILPGQDWERAIRTAIRESSYFIALISENSVGKRGYVQKELRIALDFLDEFPPDDIFVIPVRMDDSKPRHERLKRLHWVDLFPSYEDALERVCKSLGLEHLLDRHPKDVEAHEPVVASKGEIPNEVVATIRENAKDDHPEDFSTQKYVIDNQVKAWYQLQDYEPVDVPREVVDEILEQAREQHPSDFSTQIYVAHNQIDAWNQIKSLEPEEVPTDIVRQIVRSAANNHPGDYSTQMYVIRNEIETWRSLNT